MDKTPVLRLSFFLLTLSVFVTGCSRDPADMYIQGKWARGNAHFWNEWNFDSGSYWYVYDDTHSNLFQRGQYVVLESGEDFIFLELINQQGGIDSIEEKVELRILFDLENDTIHLRQNDFTRVITSSLIELATQQAP
jgi:hypothetical protein